MQKREPDRSRMNVSAIGLSCIGLNTSHASSISNDEGVALIRPLRKYMKR